MKKNGKDVIAFALQFVGRPYVLGAVVPKDQADYDGPFDCAELCAFSNFQTFGFLYGCSTDDEKKAAIADAYTGYFGKDAKALGVIISVADGAKIAGAMLLRLPAPGTTGHIVFSQGNGKTVEAHSTKHGCIESVVTGRRFDMAVLLPKVEYDKPNEKVLSEAPKIVYRLKTPYMKDEYIKKIQGALRLKADGIFGMDTHNAVVAFQKSKGLVIDGEVMPGGETSGLLGI